MKKLMILFVSFSIGLICGFVTDNKPTIDSVKSEVVKDSIRNQQLHDTICPAFDDLILLLEQKKKEKQIASTD